MLDSFITLMNQLQKSGKCGRTRLKVASFNQGYLSWFLYIDRK